MGRVLKAPTDNRIPAIVDAALADARAVVAAAERRAAELIRDAQARAEAIEDAARVTYVASLHDLAARSEAELSVLGTERQRELAELAVGVGAKLAGRAFERDPKLLDDLIRDATSKLVRATSFRVRVHPDDASIVAETFPAFAVLADDSLDRGDAVIESDVGRVDARLGVRLSAIRQALGLEKASA